MSRRVALRIKEAVGQNSSLNKNTDLSAAIQQFNRLKNYLRTLIANLKAYHQSLVMMNKTRMETARVITALSANSPIADCSGKLPSEDAPNICSYASIHTQISKQTYARCQKYQEYVINYAITWEKTVTTRISVSIKKAENLRRELDHYHNKVESLRANVNVQMAKGKSVDPKVAEKLTRNEEKFAKSKGEYLKFSHALSTLIDELTSRSWRDLLPLLTRMAQFDYTTGTEEAKLLANLNLVLKQLKTVGQKHDIDSRGRLKHLETMTAGQLSTKEETDAFMLSEKAAASTVNTTDAGNDWSIPVSSGTEDLLGQTTSLSIKDSSPMNSINSSTTSASSYNDFTSSNTSNNAPTPADMLAIASNAAPPPTLDMLNPTTSPPPAPPPPPPSSMPYTNYSVQQQPQQQQQWDQFGSYSDPNITYLGQSQQQQQQNNSWNPNSSANAFGLGSQDGPPFRSNPFDA